MKIEHRCKCGRCVWIEEMCPDCTGGAYPHSDEYWRYNNVSCPAEFLGEPKHCPECGCYLADNGWAYEMVRKDEALTLCERAAQFIEVGFTPMAALACARMELCETADEGSEATDRPTPAQFFEGPPINITDGVDPADYIERLRGSENPADPIAKGRDDDES